MKIQDKSKLHQASLKELTSQREELKNSLLATRLSISQGKEANLRKARTIRHQIAIINTIITQKQLQVATEGTSK